MHVAKDINCATIHGMDYTDAHCHITASVLPHGVAAVITNSARMSDWGCVARIVGAGGIYGAIGVHPWYISDLPDDWSQKMRELLTHEPALSVGEIGLDKYHPDMPHQIDIFKTQIQMARDLGRTAHIHCVGAWGRVIEILNDTTPPAIVFHGFDASPEILDRLLRYNAYFSFGRAICNPTRLRARDALRLVPKNRILTESDSDNPMDVAPVVRAMSEILSCPIPGIKKTVYDNIMDLLKNGQIT